ncbi:MAG TPA: ABC transporter ATP-binding protein [Actinomycetota bacterium]|nr:ABC transporter ATP-binding protein [Actinomycetota bacterium]
MSAASIRAAGLTKHYGRVRALEDLHLEVHPGEIVGYLGPNGAGKTTTIRLLLDFIRPTAGRAEVLGMDVREHSLPIRRRVGYLPGELALYDRMTGEEHCRYLGALRGVRDLSTARRVAERLDLDLTRPAGELSKGNKQKVGIVTALLHRPEVLVLDEPTGGLDPLIQQEFHALVREAAAGGAAVFLSSHVLTEVERVADRVAIVRGGHLVAFEAVDALKARAPRRLEVHFAGRAVPGGLATVPGVRDVRTAANVATLVVEGSVDPVVKFLAAHEVENLVSHAADLEEIFLAYYAGSRS